MQEKLADIEHQLEQLENAGPFGAATHAPAVVRSTFSLLSEMAERIDTLEQQAITCTKALIQISQGGARG